MEIRLALSPSERLAAFEFRYSVIVQELGVEIPAVDHANKLVRDADDETGHIFSAFVDGQIAGTARINFIRDGDVTPHSHLLQLSTFPSKDAMSVCSRFLVEKKQRSSLVTIRIVQAVYRFMRQSDIEFDFILVQRHLVGFYERIGWQLFGTAVTHPEIGEVLPLRLCTRDEQYLRSIRSPLVHCLSSQGKEHALTEPQTL